MSVVTLISEDGMAFEVPRAAFKKIGAFRSAAEDPDILTFPVPTVTSNILSLVVDYLKLHSEDDIISMEDGEDNAVDSEDEQTRNDSDEDSISARYSAKLGLADPDSTTYSRYTDLLEPRDRSFLSSLPSLPTLIELTKAANYLFIPALLDLCCRGLAREMRGLGVVELRKKFKIVNDFSPEEEERVRKECLWAYE